MGVAGAVGDTFLARGCPLGAVGEPIGCFKIPMSEPKLLMESGRGDAGKLTLAGLTVWPSDDVFGCSLTWLNLESGLDMGLSSLCLGVVRLCSEFSSGGGSAAKGLGLLLIALSRTGPLTCRLEREPSRKTSAPVLCIVDER
jgi:hypothetical protein